MTGPCCEVLWGAKDGYAFTNWYCGAVANTKIGDDWYCERHIPKKGRLIRIGGKLEIL